VGPEAFPRIFRQTIADRLATEYVDDMKIKRKYALALLARLEPLVFFAVFLPIAACASDWPLFLGPTRDAVYSGPPLADEWPREGPAVVWRARAGEGYSSPVISDGRLVLTHRVGNEMLVICYEMLTGKTNWSSRYPMKFQED
jgi:hypothetical protein